MLTYTHMELSLKVQAYCLPSIQQINIVLPAVEIRHHPDNLQIL